MGWVEADTERLNALAYRIALRAADGTRQAEDDLAEFRDLNARHEAYWDAKTA